MIIIYNCVEFIATFLEGFIIGEFMRGVFSELNGKKYLKYNVYFGLVYMVCIRVLYMFTFFPYTNILLAIFLIFVYVMVAYKKKAVVSLSISSFYMLCMSVYSLATLAFISAFGNNGELYKAVLLKNSIEKILYIVISRVIMVFLCLFIKNMFKKMRVQCEFGYKSLVIIMIGTIGTAYLKNETLNAFNVYLTYAWMLIITILVLILFYIYAKAVDKANKHELQVSEMRNVLLEEKYRSIKEIYANNAKLYHDLNNHLNVLYTLLKAENIEEAQQYITEIGVPIRKLSNISWTGNEVIDIMINYEIDKMKDKNIDYDIKACFPADTNLNAQDIGIMIGNLLDNAIEAMEKSKAEGKIKLSMKQIHQFLIVKVTNPCEEELIFSGLYPETTKKDKEHHGWGFKSVLDIVNKYDGSLKCRNNEGVFEVNILLMIDSI